MRGWRDRPPSPPRPGVCLRRTPPLRFRCVCVAMAPRGAASWALPPRRPESHNPAQVRRVKLGTGAKPPRPESAAQAARAASGRPPARRFLAAWKTIEVMRGRGNKPPLPRRRSVCPRPDAALPSSLRSVEASGSRVRPGTGVRPDPTVSAPPPGTAARAARAASGRPPTRRFLAAWKTIEVMRGRGNMPPLPPRPGVCLRRTPPLRSVARASRCAARRCRAAPPAPLSRKPQARANPPLFLDTPAPGTLLSPPKRGVTIPRQRQ